MQLNLFLSAEEVTGADLDRLADDFIERAIALGFSRDRLYLECLLRRVTGEVEQLPRQMQKEFCARLIERFLSE